MEEALIQAVLNRVVVYPCEDPEKERFRFYYVLRGLQRQAEAFEKIKIVLMHKALAIIYTGEPVKDLVVARREKDGDIPPLGIEEPLHDIEP